MKEYSQKETIKTVLKYGKKYILYFIFSILLAAVTVALTLYVPILTGRAIDLIVGKGNVSFASMMARNSSAVSLLPPRIQAVAWRSQTSNVWQVSCFCPMPAVTKEMIQWWLWWHPQENLRYQA